MGDEIDQLRSVFRSLVVSSPTQVDVRSLMRDYRKMIGAPVPLHKFGYRDPVEFLKERFSDCFLFTGQHSNPVLTLIVPNTLKHIDKFVQRQKVPSTAKHNPKRRSVSEEIVSSNQNLITKTFTQRSNPLPSIEEPDNKCNIESSSNYNIENGNNTSVHTPHSCKDSDNSNAVKNFLRKRMPVYNTSQYVTEDLTPGKCDKLLPDEDSGRHTMSSDETSKAQKFEQLKVNILQLVADRPEGVWCTDLLRLYKERYQRELDFSYFGYTSVISLVYSLESELQIVRPERTGDWLLQDRAAPAARPPASRPPASRPLAVRPPRPPTPDNRDSDEALPGIAFDPDVFPEDCMDLMESIEPFSLDEFRRGAIIEVVVGEVYSPSHFWFLRLGENHRTALEKMMDDMNRYYNKEGRHRFLARGAIRVGHYCTSVFERDWHRSLIVKIIDSETVKVRHVDYGTVETVEVGALKPLRREWARLPAQAARARLGGVRPPAAGWRWPLSASAAFLALVSDRPLVASVVAVDRRDAVAELLLVDTAGDDDVNVGDELVRAGHADARPDTSLRAPDVYLYPRFEALESGATPNYAEIFAYLRDGIALEYVEEYRAHVPAVPPHPPRSPDSTDSTDSRPSSQLPRPILSPDVEDAVPETDRTVRDLPEPEIPLPRVSETDPKIESNGAPQLTTRIPLHFSIQSSSETLSPELSQTNSQTEEHPSTAQELAGLSVSQNSISSCLSADAPVYVPGQSYSVHRQVVPSGWSARYACPAPQRARRPLPMQPPRPPLLETPRPPLLETPRPPLWQPPRPQLQQTPPAVTLTITDYERYRSLSAMNPMAAHWYITAVMERGLASTYPPPQYPMHGPHTVPMFPPPNAPYNIRPPPGFRG